jgi:hypothetical protein
MRPIVSRDLAVERLLRIFPRAAFDPVLSSPLAGAAIAAMLYTDAVVPEEGDVDASAVWARPSTCLWMSEATLVHAADFEREEWRDAARIGKKQLAQTVASWGASFAPWYADNSRETLRDETFPAWKRYGAMRQRPGVATSSPLPRWALTAEFADLFDPELGDDSLSDAIAAWRASHFGPGEMLKINVSHQADTSVATVLVTLPPQGVVRTLSPGVASMIMKGVVEQWAPARMAQPFVLTISEPGDKLYVADAAMLSAIGVSINVSGVLPDAVIFDVGAKPPDCWIIEVVATDGEINEDRKAQLLQWATDQKIPAATCHFLSAFLSRNADPARKRLKDLAVGTYAWYLDEPSRELRWDEI